MPEVHAVEVADGDRQARGRSRRVSVRDDHLRTETVNYSAKARGAAGERARQADRLLRLGFETCDLLRPICSGAEAFFAMSERPLPQREVQVHGRTLRAPTRHRCAAMPSSAAPP
ncbi:MAG: hypothetical protein RML56_14035 [Burkholderiales bacterium]|nr:hypothetical protein [Burkholderiales bacterium]